MPNPKHLAKLSKGAELWNQFRRRHPDLIPDLSGVKLPQVDLGGADLSKANLREAELGGWFSHASFVNADLTHAVFEDSEFAFADLRNANLCRACLASSRFNYANLGAANLIAADLRGASFREADLSFADLSHADLSTAIFIDTNMEGANLTASRVFGISAWNVRLERAIQSNLVISDWDEPPIEVDNLEMAQFIYLLLNNQKLRSVIDTITSKVVLILGRFTSQRKAVLDAIRDELRRRKYLPILFDFEKPASKDLTGTISTLANLARFIIADLTDPSSVPHELATVVPGTVVAVQTIILKGQREYAMFADLKKRFHWVLEPYPYVSQELLLCHLGKKVIAPAEAKAKKLLGA